MEASVLALARFPRPLARLLALVALAAIGGLDYATGRPLTLSLLYGMVVVLMGWMDGTVGVVVTAGLAAGLDLSTDFAFEGGAHLELVDVVNEVLRTAMWTLMGLGAAALRGRMDVVDRQRRALSDAYRRIREDMEAAERVQQSFLLQGTPTDPRFEMALRYLPARGLSGDFYSYSLKEDRLSLCVADVSGKGPPAALVTALLRGALDEACRTHDRPGEILQTIHDRVFPYLPEAMFITCFFAHVDLQAGVLIYASAGHDPAFLRRSTGALEDLVNTGLPLGVEEVQTYRERDLPMDPEDCLLVYTDGLVNARTGPRRRLGEEPVREILVDTPEPERLLTHLQGLISPPPEDDVVLLALRLRPSPLPPPGASTRSQEPAP